MVSQFYLRVVFSILFSAFSPLVQSATDPIANRGFKGEVCKVDVKIDRVTGVVVSQCERLVLQEFAYE